MIDFISSLICPDTDRNNETLDTLALVSGDGSFSIMVLVLNSNIHNDCSIGLNRGAA